MVRRPSRRPARRRDAWAAAPTSAAGRLRLASALARGSGEIGHGRSIGRDSRIPSRGPAEVWAARPQPRQRGFEVLTAQGMRGPADSGRGAGPGGGHCRGALPGLRVAAPAQLARGLRAPPPTASADSVVAQLARLKWFCWHGNVFRALQTVEDLVEFRPRRRRRWAPSSASCSRRLASSAATYEPTLTASPTTGSAHRGR